MFTRHNGLFTLAALSFIILSCDHGVSSKQTPERIDILFGIESFNGMTGRYINGIYIDSKGSIYSVTSSIIQSSIGENGYRSDSLSSLIISKGVLRSTRVPSDSLLIMNSLIDEVKLSTDSARVFIGADMGGSCWFAFDPVPAINQHKLIVLKEDGSWQYHLLSEQAMRLTTMIDKYCTN